MDEGTVSRAKPGHSKLAWDIPRAQRDGCSVDGFVHHVHDTTSSALRTRSMNTFGNPLSTLLSLGSISSRAS
jgi:hypothetical protein